LSGLIAIGPAGYRSQRAGAIDIRSALHMSAPTITHDRRSERRRDARASSQLDRVSIALAVWAGRIAIAFETLKLRPRALIGTFYRL
jgi:hypothetical protein